MMWMYCALFRRGGIRQKAPHLAASSAEAAVRTGPNYCLDVLHHLSVVMQLVWKRPLLKDAIKSGSTVRCSGNVEHAQWPHGYLCEEGEEKEQCKMNTPKLGQQWVASVTLLQLLFVSKGQIYSILCCNKSPQQWASQMGGKMKN